MGAAVGSGPNHNALEKRLAQAQKKAPINKDFKVKVTQVFYSALRKKERKTEGTLQFSPPKSFRWQLGDDVFIYNGKQLWKYNSRAKHAAKLGSDKLAELNFLDAILKPVTFAKEYDVRSWGLLSFVKEQPAPAPEQCQNSAVLCLRLIPKNESSINTILTSLNVSQGWVEELQIVYQDGNKALLQFTSYETTKAAPGTFDFVPPAGTAVDKF